MPEADAHRARTGTDRLAGDLSAQIFWFAEGVDHCRDMQALSSLTQDAIRMVGMTVVASGFVSGPKSRSTDLFHFTTWPSGWMELYLASGFLDKDPIPRWAIVSGRPISFSKLFRQLSKDDPGHEVFDTGAKWGFTEGFVTPARSLDGSFGLVSVAGDREELQPRECLFLQSISVAAFHRAETLADMASSGGAPHPLTLKVRESLAGGQGLHHGRHETWETEVQRALGLTSAEWRVALGLYRGESLQELAALHQTSSNTIRTQLSAIFSKTNTHRQVELVAFLRSAFQSKSAGDR